MHEICFFWFPCYCFLLLVLLLLFLFSFFVVVFGVGSSLHRSTGRMTWQMLVSGNFTLCDTDDFV